MISQRKRGLQTVLVLVQGLLIIVALGLCIEVTSFFKNFSLLQIQHYPIYAFVMMVGLFVELARRNHEGKQVDPFSDSFPAQHRASLHQTLYAVGALLRLPRHRARQLVRAQHARAAHPADLSHPAFLQPLPVAPDRLPAFPRRAQGPHPAHRHAGRGRPSQEMAREQGNLRHGHHRLPQRRAAERGARGLLLSRHHGGGRDDHHPAGDHPGHPAPAARVGRRPHAADGHAQPPRPAPAHLQQSRGKAEPPRHLHGGRRAPLHRAAQGAAGKSAQPHGQADARHRRLAAVILFILPPVALVVWIIQCIYSPGPALLPPDARRHPEQPVPHLEIPHHAPQQRARRGRPRSTTPASFPAASSCAA